MSEIDIENKIRNNISPTDKEKELLQNKLNKQLSEDDHMYIFVEILQTLKNKIYTMTENGTLFDLNDLDNENFWKIFYHTQLFIDNHEREKKIAESSQEKAVLESKFNKTNEENLKQNITKDVEVETSTYGKLRIEALKQCSYSNYSINSTSNVKEPSFFSDKVQQKWAQPKNTAVSQKVNKILKTTNNKVIEPVPVPTPESDSESDDTDIVDDDIIENDNCEDDDVSEEGLKILKLIKPKIKLVIKSQQQQQQKQLFEEDEDEEDESF